MGKEGLAAEMKREGFTPAEFRSRIEMRLLSEAVVMKKAPVSVSDAELKQVFEKQKDQLGRPESVRLSRLLFKTEKEAQDAVSKLKAGASFADMASKLSIDKLTKGKGGSVGIVPVSALVPEVAKVVSGLEVGGISKPIDDVDGFYVLRLDERLPAAPANFDEIKVQLREAVTGVKMRQALPQIIAELRKNAKITQPEAGKKSK
ncbi:MAG: hypothetical protein GX410_02705 [Elusimicrobia bacterium]|nr:hypothetical protein [Elusimicrobiota bacterium]